MPLAATIHFAEEYLGDYEHNSMFDNLLFHLDLSTSQDGSQS